MLMVAHSRNGTSGDFAAIKTIVMLKKINPEKVLLIKVKAFLKKNRCSLPEEDVVELEVCIASCECNDNADSSFESKQLWSNILLRMIDVLARYFLIKEIHDFFDN